jgi:RNA polymerase sigma-32 factor
MHAAALGSNPFDAKADEEHFEVNVDGDALYRDKVFRYANLEADEELALARRWRSDGDLVARDKLITAHLKLVQSMAAKYCGGVFLDDVVSEGTLALIRAVDGFDPENGVRLATYAMRWIKGAMLKHLKKNRSIVGGLKRDPAVMREASRKEFQWDLSLNEMLGVEDDGGDTWQDHVAFDGVDTVIAQPGNIAQIRDYQEAILAEVDFRNTVTRVMNSVLTSRERYVLEERCFAGKTREDLSKELGVSRERIRQIETRAFEKVRRAAEDLNQCEAVSGPVVSARRAA